MGRIAQYPSYLFASSMAVSGVEVTRALENVVNGHFSTDTVTITVRTPALCLLETLDKSFSLCLPYSSFTLCLIRTDNLISLLIPSLVCRPCSTYDSFLVTNTVVLCPLFSTSPCIYKFIRTCT